MSDKAELEVLIKSIEKIAIIGAGALGATYGSLLYELDPESVCFIASGDRYERLRRDGVIVNCKTRSFMKS